MDPRQPQTQHPFPRPQDRPLIHNPNHQPAPQSQHSYSSYAPPTSQPPVHVPLPDPFPRHNDPFMPPPQHQRRPSYGVHGAEGTGGAQGDGRAPLGGSWGGNGPQHHHSIDGRPLPQPPPPPPPAMPTSNTAAGQTSYPYDDRRRSLGGEPPSRYYAGSSHEPPPPPPSYGPRAMPPPSSPQQPSHSQTPSQRGSHPPAFPTGRELPGLGSGHRPGSSMSISSIIGGESRSGRAVSQTSPSMSAATGSPSSTNMQPPSPRRGPVSGYRSDMGPYRRAPSPEKYRPNSSSSIQPEAHYATSPSQGSRESPELTRQRFGRSPGPYKHTASNSMHQLRSPILSAHERDNTRLPVNGMPPRPNSQPNGLANESAEPGRSQYDASGFRRPGYGMHPAEDRNGAHRDPYQTGPGSGEQNSHSSRDRPVTVQPVSQSAFSPPKDRKTSLPQGLESQGNDLRQTQKEEAGFRTGYGHLTMPNPGAAGRDDPQRPPRMYEHLHHRNLEQYQAPPTSDPRSQERRRADFRGPSPTAGGGYPARSSYDGQSRRGGEEMQPSRSLLGLGPDVNRRTGRASPMPQAVQGAQAPPVGPVGDPNIKSEFGRMFSGLGMGGLGTTPTGTATPSRSSPLPHNRPDAGHGDDSKLVRVSSQNGRKVRKVKDEDYVMESDNADGRGTPGALSGGRLKRAKLTHPAHHHHHHPHAHHHHHHHHRQDEDQVQAATPVIQSAASLNPLHLGASNPSTTLPQLSHHHHHHRPTHPPHHHHHAPRVNPTAAAPAPRMPTIDVSALLELASKNERKHLGSQLYETKVVIPPAKVSLDDPFGYESVPKPLPIFTSDHVNGTFTVRVPRYFLQEPQRREICSRRHLWGARVYRDDSDPLAAAIHSGWIRGAWDPDTPLDKLDPRILAPSDPRDSQEVLESKPAAPVVPPPEMDLQITLLILPPLEEYPQTVEYGLKSHSYNYAWRGMSFMIHKIRWVEEGPGSRGFERGAAALKNRLHAANALLSLATATTDSLGRSNGTRQLMAS